MDVTIRCISAVTADWQKNEKRIPKKKHIRVDGNTLHIYQATDEDRGKYSCFGRDEHGHSFVNTSTIYVGST